MYLPTEPCVCVYLNIYIYIVMMVHLVFETGFFERVSMCGVGVCVSIAPTV